MSGALETFVWGSFDACHRSRDGVIHGHSWEVEAGWDAALLTDALAVRAAFDAELAALDHTVLDDALAWAEPLAAQLGERLAADYVVIRRRSQRLGARWRRC